MTDKQIIETLKNIKNHCIKNDCDNCIFALHDVAGSECQIQLLFARLYETPNNLDIEMIERILSR